MTNALTGTWTLLEFKRAFSDSEEQVDLMGSDPSGVLSVSEDGYLTVVITNTHRTSDDSPAELFGGMMAYSGWCTVEAGQFTTHVENAWYPAWVGTDQVRYFQIDGDVLRISTPEQLHPAFPERPGRGILAWRRLKKPA